MRRLLRSAVALLRPALLPGVALLFSAVGALFFHIDSASGAATDPICTFSSGTLSIDLLGSTVTIADDGTNYVITPGTSCPGPYPVVGVTTITFSVDSSTGSASTVVLDQTNHAFPCVPIGGSVGTSTAGDGTVEVKGADGENLTVGTTGINLAPGTCDSSVGTLTDVAIYVLDDTHNTGAVTLSAAGGSGTGSPATVDAQLTSGGASNTFVAGAGVETFAQTGKGVGDTLDFSHVFTNPGLPLAVNVSGGSGSGTASLSSILTYTFTTGAAAFTTLVGPTTGYTTFLASGAGGYSFSATGSNNAIDFSAAASGVNVNLSAATENTLAPGEVGVPGGVDTLSGLTTVTGSAAGGNSFYAGATGPYTFRGNGNNNVFTGGTGSDTFSTTGTGNHFVVGTGSAVLNGTAAGNTVDFSALTAPLTVNVSGSQVGMTATGTATTSSTTYTFTGLTAPTTFIGATPTSGGTAFDAGSDADTFQGQGLASDTLSYAHASGASLTLCTAKLSSGTCASVPSGSTGVAVLGTAVEPFSGIPVLDGLAGGNTTFVSGTVGGYTFNASNGGNAADFTAATSGVPGVSVDLSASSATVTGFASGGADDMTGITAVTGSAAGQNRFRAGAGSETFAQPGSGVGDALDLSQVATGSFAPLSVDVAGGPGNDTAVVGTATYTFTSGGAAFTRLTGANTGYTTFTASGAGGYSFSAAGSHDAIDFSASASGVNVNLSPSIENTLASGDVGVPGGVDTLTGLTTVTGSSAGGNSFYAGSGGPYTFTGNGNSNVFTGGAGADVFSSTGTGNRFAVGTGGAILEDPESGNTIDFSALTVPLTVNVSGGQVGVTSSGTATTSSTTYDFTGVAAPATFIGATPAGGGTTFDAGALADTFHGQGLAGDTLSYADASGSPLTLCLAKLSSGTCSAVPAGSTGEAVLGSVAEPFSGISVLDGLAGGNTTFVSGAPGGFQLDGQGTGNTLDLSAAPSGTVVTVNGDSFAHPGTVTHLGAGLRGSTSDTFAGIQSFVGPVAIVSPVQALPSTLRRMTVASPFRQQLIGTGGTAPYSGWSIQSGAPPPGITLSSTGLLAGTPTTAGTFTFEVALVDAQHQPGATSYSVTVAPPSLVVLPWRLPNATVGTTYSVSLHTSGGTAPYTYVITSGALPPGLRLDAATGVISGTPSTAGSFTFVVEVRDSSTTPGPYTVTRRYTLTVSGP